MTWLNDLQTGKRFLTGTSHTDGKALRCRGSRETFGRFPPNNAPNCTSSAALQSPNILQGTGNFLDFVSFEDVSFLQVVEAGQFDTALEAFADFLGVVLLALQRVH